MTAHWSDLDEELLVSADKRVPKGSLLDGTQTVLLPREGRGIELVGSCSSPSESFYSPSHAVPFVLCFQGISLVRDQ